MKLEKVKRIEKDIYRISYVSGRIFKKHITAFVYCWVGYWRFSATGEYLPYDIGTSLSTICHNLKDGEEFLINPEGVD